MERPTERTIAHADMDAFYASVEQRDRPELRGRPVIVGGGGPRGVVSAASYEARRFGVHSAMPGYEARRRCPDGVFLSGDMARYRRESRRIFEIFRRFTPAVEGLSLDEAFLDLTGTERLLGPARAVGERLRREVRAETGLAVSVGIAPIKMVAKLASESAKPDGLLEVGRAGLLGFLHPLPVRRLWGVGPVAGERLEAAGFRTVADLARADAETLRRLLGDWGLRLASLSRGEDVREVEPYREAVSMSEENTFASDVDDVAQLERAIVRHAESVARRLRRSELLARTVVLKVKLGRRRAPGPRGHALVTRRATLPEASDDGATLARVASGLLAAWGLPEPVRLVGVGVTNLVPCDGAQLPLFEEGRARRERLNRALDAIADRFGSDAVARGEPDAARRAGLSDQIKRGVSDDEG
ncbi:MAG TPA: DNA polymerase IV [Myxococcota bacterium]|nr:DNA polymerase IV [Myxococcota bacterium]